LWKRAAVWPLAAIMRLWWRTIRIEIAPGDLSVVTARDRPTLFVLWHNRLFMAADIVRRYRRGRPFYSLISASKDGSWLAAFFSAVGVQAIRGSSSRRGREAASGLVEVLRSGFDAGITPDGPRGPRYEMKPGAVVVARGTGTLVVLAGMEFESSWRLSSWDGFHLPRPFSRVHLRFVAVEPDALGDGGDAARELGRRLAAINPDRKPGPVKKRA
jgi:lysophospholipid acyltransferase (LPLAT)-like uncharacterized protein